MKKMNNKGFLLVETLVVATFCLTVLVLLFLQFKNLIISYNNSYNYNTVEGVYNLDTVKKYLIKNDTLGLKTKLSDSTPYVILYSNNNCNNNLGLTDINWCNTIAQTGNFKTILYTTSDVKNLKDYVNNNQNIEDISEDMRNFIKMIESKDNRNRLIAEYNDGTFATITYGVTNDNRNTNTNSESSTMVDQNTIPEYYGYHTGDNIGKEGESINTTTLTTDAKSLDRIYYLGYDVENGLVTARYACFVLNNMQYCLRGVDNNGTSYYNQNKELLNNLQNSGVIVCSGDTCSGSGVSYLHITSGGAAYVGISENVFCGAYYRKYSRCNE